MRILKEDCSILVSALESYVDGLRKEMDGKKWEGKLADVVGEALERGDRMILRLKAIQKPDEK